MKHPRVIYDESLAAQLTHDYDGASHTHTLEQILTRASGEEAGPKIRQFLTGHPTMVVNTPTLMTGLMLQEFRNKKLMDELMGRDTGEMLVMAPAFVMYGDVEGSDSVVRVMAPTSRKRRRGRRPLIEELNQLLIDIAQLYYVADELAITSTEMIAEIEEVIEQLKDSGNHELGEAAEEVKDQVQEIHSQIRLHQEELANGNVNEADVEEIKKKLTVYQKVLKGLWNTFKITLAGVSSPLHLLRNRGERIEETPRAPEYPAYTPSYVPRAYYRPEPEPVVEIKTEPVAVAPAQEEPKEETAPRTEPV